jgi:hypothetical protein
VEVAVAEKKDFDGNGEKNHSNSNKSTNQMHQSLRFIARRLNTAQHKIE